MNLMEEFVIIDGVIDQVAAIHFKVVRQMSGNLILEPWNPRLGDLGQGWARGAPGTPLKIPENHRKFRPLEIPQFSNRFY